MNAVQLDAWRLALAAALVLVVAAVSAAAGLGLGRRLVWSTVRMVAQLALLALVLETVFALDRPLAVAGLVAAMALVAGREVHARQARPLAGWYGPLVGTGAMAVSSVGVGLFLLLVVVRAEPWWTPRYAVPLVGMLLGNTMTGVALAMERMTAGVALERDRVEARLALGHHPRAALAGLRRQAARTALMPTINAMAVTGVVALPGMMTGQILAGADPAEAVRYQAMIFIGIAAGVGLGSILAVEWCAARLVDERGRLRLDRLDGT